MKIISINLRLGERLKKKAIRDLVKENKADFLCIQETKMQVVDNILCNRLWGNENCEWVGKAAEGRS